MEQINKAKIVKWNSKNISKWNQVEFGAGGLVLCAWGNPGDGRLGNGVTTGTFYSPVQIGSDSDWEMVSAGSAHSLGIKGGKLYAWGYNYNGQLGDDTTIRKTSPVQIGSDSDWEMVSAGSAHSLGMKKSQI